MSPFIVSFLLTLSNICSFSRRLPWRRALKTQGTNSSFPFQGRHSPSTPSLSEQAFSTSSCFARRRWALDGSILMADRSDPNRLTCLPLQDNWELGVYKIFIFPKYCSNFFLKKHGKCSLIIYATVFKNYDHLGETKEICDFIF